MGCRRLFQAALPPPEPGSRENDEPFSPRITYVLLAAKHIVNRMLPCGGHPRTWDR